MIDALVAVPHDGLVDTVGDDQHQRHGALTESGFGLWSVE